MITRLFGLKYHIVLALPWFYPSKGFWTLPPNTGPTAHKNIVLFLRNIIPPRSLIIQCHRNAHLKCTLYMNMHWSCPLAAMKQNTFPGTMLGSVFQISSIFGRSSKHSNACYSLALITWVPVCLASPYRNRPHRPSDHRKIQHPGVRRLSVKSAVQRHCSFKGCAQVPWFCTRHTPG